MSTPFHFDVGATAATNATVATELGRAILLDVNRSFNAATTTSQVARTWLEWVTNSGVTGTHTYTTTGTAWRTTEAWMAWQNAPQPGWQRRRESARETLILANRERSRDLRRRIAQRRAEALLLENLDEAQAEQWKAERAFTLETADGARRYRIRSGVAGNITLEKDGAQERTGRGLRRYCFHAVGDCPVEDNVLAQKLFIETDEQAFLRLANPA